MLRQAIYVENPPEVARVDPQIGWNVVSGSYLSRATRVILVDGNSDMAATCVWMEKGSTGNNRFCQYLCLGDCYPSSPCPDPGNSVSPLRSLKLFKPQPQSWSSE